MRKYITIGIVASLLIASLVWHHFRLPSDSTIRKEMPGTWVVNLGHDAESTTTVQPDGSFLCQIHGWTKNGSIVRLRGTCQVEAGTLIMTVTSDSRTNLTTPTILHGQIIHWDDSRHVVRWSGMPYDTVSERVRS